MNSIFHKLNKILYCFVVGLNLIITASEAHETRLILKNNKDMLFMFDIEFNGEQPPYYFYQKFYQDKYKIAVYIFEWLLSK